MDVRGLRAIQLTTEAGVYPRTVTEYLAGRSAPTPQKMIQMTKWLRVPPNVLLEDHYPWLPEDQLKKEQVA